MRLGEAGGESVDMGMAVTRSKNQDQNRMYNAFESTYNPIPGLFGWFQWDFVNNKFYLRLCQCFIGGSASARVVGLRLQSHQDQLLNHYWGNIFILLCNASGLLE